MKQMKRELFLVDVDLEALAKKSLGGDVHSITQVQFSLDFIVSGKLNEVHFIYRKHFSNVFSGTFAFNSLSLSREACGFSPNHTAGNVDPLS